MLFRSDRLIAYLSIAETCATYRDELRCRVAHRCDAPLAHRSDLPATIASVSIHNEADRHAGGSGEERLLGVGGEEWSTEALEECDARLDGWCVLLRVEECREHGVRR